MEELRTLFEKTFPFWTDLSEMDKETLIRTSKNVTFEKNTNIHDGNECTGVIIIKSGSLRLYMLSDEGKDITLYRLFAQDMCMLSASCVLQTVTFDVFVDAEENSDCILIPGYVFKSITDRVQSAKIFALEKAISRFSDVMWVVQQILCMSIDKRLAVFLWDECVKNNSDVIKLTHEQIAKYMGTAREVVSRMLKYFAQDGIVSVSRGEGIKILDKKRLRALI